MMLTIFPVQVAMPLEIECSILVFFHYHSTPKEKQKKKPTILFLQCRNVSQTFDKKFCFFTLKNKSHRTTATLLLRVPSQCASETEHQITRITPGPRLAAMKMPLALDWSLWIRPCRLWPRSHHTRENLLILPSLVIWFCPGRSSSRPTLRC